MSQQDFATSVKEKQAERNFNARQRKIQSGQRRLTGAFYQHRDQLEECLTDVPENVFRRVLRRSLRR